MFSHIKCTRIYNVQNLLIIMFGGGQGLYSLKITFRHIFIFIFLGGGCSRRIGQLLTSFKRMLHVLTHTKAVVGS